MQKLEADVVIDGSGPGGATIAGDLSKIGNNLTSRIKKEVKDEGQS